MTATRPGFSNAYLILNRAVADENGTFSLAAGVGKAPQTTNAEEADFRGADLDSCLMYRAETQSARFDVVLLFEKSDIPGRKVFGTIRVIA